MRQDGDFIGILPAAGTGSRLKPLRCPKELIPIAFITDPKSGTVKPMLAAEYSLQAMSLAGIHRCIMVISDRKPEMLRYFGDGKQAGLNIAYVNQAEPLGLAAAVDTAFEWIAYSNVCLALPDAVFSPLQSLALLRRNFFASKADLLLGVFPTSNPQHLGPVRFRPDGEVIEVLEKPISTDLRNTWGLAVWKPQFTAFLHSMSSGMISGSIGRVFDHAVREGLRVRAIYIREGSYTDLGTGEALAAIIYEGSIGAKEESLISGPRFSGVGQSMSCDRGSL